jgi:hypothetical protein
MVESKRPVGSPNRCREHARTREIGIDLGGDGSAFGNGPHNEGCPTTRVPGNEHTRNVCLEICGPCGETAIHNYFGLLSKLAGIGSGKAE